MDLVSQKLKDCGSMNIDKNFALDLM